RSVLDAARGVSATLAAGVLPRALELIDDVCIRAIDGKGFHFPKEAGAALLAEVDGTTDEALLPGLAALEEICRHHGAVDTAVADEEAERNRLWGMRRILSTALRSLQPFKLSEDIAVPRSRIPEAIERFKALGREMGLTIATYGHAGDGNLHANVLFNT